MKILFSLFLLSLVLVSCENKNNGLYQYSTIDILMRGYYDGNVSLSTCKSKGNFGIGTFNTLDGELVMLDGEIYQAKENGTVILPPDIIKTPFISVCNFTPTTRLEIEGAADIKSVESVLEQQIEDKNAIYAVKISGEFDSISLRSVRPQSKPYRPLLDVVKNQSTYSSTMMQGTLVGYLCPEMLGKVSVKGLHLHFISSDFKKAGHVIDLAFKKIVNFELCKISEINLQLMSTTDNAATSISEKDIQQVER